VGPWDDLGRVRLRRLRTFEPIKSSLQVLQLEILFHDLLLVLVMLLSGLWMAVGCAVMRGNSIRFWAQQQVKMKQDKSEIPETTSSTRYRLHQLHQWQLLLEVLECEGEHCNEVLRFRFGDPSNTQV
jgi:hypothetical protein